MGEEEKMIVIKLADRRIRIENIYPYIEDYCKEYIVHDTDRADLTVRVTNDDIEYERQKSEREDIALGRPVRHFSDEYLETLAAYRKIAEKMPDYDTFLFHGSAIAVDGTGYIFTAKSGTGKSTHTRLRREFFGERVVMVNDDKPLIRIKSTTDKNPDKKNTDTKNTDTKNRENCQAVVYGTPWDGKHRLSSNICVPVRAVCILERGTDNTIEKIGKIEAMPMLIQQSYRPKDKSAMAKTLSLIDSFASCTALYRMRCNMDIEAAEIAYKAMNGSNDYTH